MKSLGSKFTVLGFVAGTVLALDQWTKSLVLQRFELHESITIIPGFFQLTYVRNPGVAFGFLSTAPIEFRSIFLTVVPVIAVCFLVYLIKKLRSQDRYLQIAYSAIVGGALGNFWDRIQFGYVVDSLDFHWNYSYHFPAFNIADSAICVGVGLLLLESLFQSIFWKNGTGRNSHLKSY